MNESLKQPVLLVEGLSKAVSRVGDSVGDNTGDENALHILDDIGLSIQRGESLAIVGPSGAGKSTLLGLLAGLDVPSAGKVILDGEDMFSLSEDDRAALRGEKIGFVFQSFQLLPSFTARENVMLPLELQERAEPGRDARRAAEQLLGQVGLTARMHHYPSQLSGGEQQRVAIARAFVTQPALLFADEPTGNLDARTSQQVIDFMFALNHERDTTLVLVTHDHQLAARCERVLTLQDGRVQTLQ